MRFVQAVVVFCLIEAMQFGLTCSMKVDDSLLLGAPFSIAVALMVHLITHPPNVSVRRHLVFWAAVGALALIGLPLLLLGHICG